MGITDRDSLQGELEVVGRPQTICWKKPEDFIDLLLRIIKVKFPVNLGNDFIVRGFRTPGVDDRNRMWARFDKNGNPMGWWAFVKGGYRQFYDVAPGEVRWFIGNSKSPAPGWQPLTHETNVPAAIVDSYMADYVTDGADGFVKYAARYIGYTS